MSVRILAGDCRQKLRELPEASVHTCVTSPPYFSLRDYNVAGQIGLEPTPAEFVAELVAVFREVRRVLRDDGTIWVNLGDSYAGSWGAQGRQGESGQMAGRAVAGQRQRKSISDAQIKAHPQTASHTGSIREPGLKPKDLIGIPWRVAFALQADGWYLRQDIIWAKPNPMPESVTDRCTKSHEYIFLLSKGPKYYFDQDAILEPVSPGTHARLAQNGLSDRVPGKTNGNMKAVARKFDPGKGNKNNASFDAAMAVMPSERNKRSVWTVTTQPFSGAHFATFPSKLIEPCILAGCPSGGTVLDPFAGAFTTSLVCEQLGRNSISIELNPEYIEMGRARLRGDGGLFFAEQIAAFPQTLADVPVGAVPASEAQDCADRHLAHPDHDDAQASLLE